MQLVTFVVSCDHSFVQCGWFLAKRTGVNMDDHEHGKRITGNDVDHIIDHEATDSEYPGGNDLGEQHAHSGYDQ